MSFLDCPTCRSIGGLCADHLASMSAPYPPTLLESLIGGRPQQSCLSGPGPYLQNNLSGWGPGIANAKPCDDYTPCGTDACETCGHSMYSHDLSKSTYVAALSVSKYPPLRPFEEVRALGTPIRWYHRLWWRVQRWWT